jgi:carboxyl-terminal processing protease
MKKRLLYGILIAGLSLNLVVGVQIYLSAAQTGGKEDVRQHLELFVRVLERVRKDYVDGEKLSYRDLINGALRGMLNTLDPHSEFMEPDKYKDLKDDTEGAFGGLGITVGLRDDHLTVIAPMEDSPASRAGIMTGDRIIKIEGRITDRFTLEDAVKKLRGEIGTDVTITTLRPSTGVSRDIRLTRAIIKVDTVKDINGRREFPLGTDRIGYVRLTQFTEPTENDLTAALKKLSDQGMQGLVLDLRGNPGGLLDQAAKVCENFLPARQVIVTTEGRNAGEKSAYVSSGRGSYQKLPMVILVNGGSASASEIVAGCMQDLKRAILIGEQTFGKGSVQKILPMPDGSALRLTTAKYYTPSHRVIHGEGVTPDMVVPLTAEEEEALALRRATGGVETLEGAQKDKALATRDPQLERAKDLLKGITLFSHRTGSEKASAARR